MSLFGGAPGNPTSSSGGLFANLGANNNTSNNNNTSSGGLFSNLAKSQAPPAPSSGSSLFGAASNTTQGQPAGSSLFGASAQPSSQPSGGLFGGLAANKTTTTAAPSTGLFSNLVPTSSNDASNNTKAQQTSLFGRNDQSLQEQQDKQGQGASAAALPGQPARFLDLLERGKKNRSINGDGSRLDDLPTLQLGLGDISSRIRNLTGAAQSDSRADYVLSGSGVPRGATRRNLDDFGNQAGASTSDATVPYETDIDAYIANLRAKSTLDLINESMEQTKRDFDTFLDNHLSMNLDAQRRRAYEYFGLARPSEEADNGAGATLGGSFGGSKSRAINGKRSGAFGRSTFRNGASGSASILGRSTLRGTARQSQFTDAPDVAAGAAQMSASDDPYQQSRQDSYASAVRSLNSARLQETVYPVIENFAHVELTAGGDVPKHLIDAYRALKNIVKENPKAERPSDPLAIRERQYRDSYLESSENSPRGVQLRKQIIDGSRQYLEQSFFEQVKEEIKRNRTGIDIGGVPSNINRMKAFVNLRGQQKKLAADTTSLQMIGSEFCWALIFFLLRAGMVDEANNYVKENERAIKNMDRNFALYMGYYASEPERRLPREVLGRLQSEYGQRSRLAPEQSIDPYRMACLKVIGRCEISKKTLEGIESDVEDFLWLNFALAREVNRAEEVASDVYGLEDVRATIDDIGQRFFAQTGPDGASTYAMYFLMQILTGMFEKAVAWLNNWNYVAAVHFAIALDFYGLLRVSDYESNPDTLLTYTTTQKPQLNFCALVGHYTTDFRLVNAEAAADYLTLLCLNADLAGDIGKAHIRLAHMALKDLVLGTREFALLLGDVQGDGRRVPGVIEERLPLLRLADNERDEFLRNITADSANAADSSGRTTDAVLLYHLADQVDNVMAICNRSLSNALLLPMDAEPLRLQPLKPRSTGIAPVASSTLSLTSVDDPVVLAQNMYGLYEANGLQLQRVRQETQTAYHILLHISNVRKLLSNQQWAETVDEAAKTTLLPINVNGNTHEIMARAQMSASQPQVIGNVVPNLLVWTVQALGRERENLRRNAWNISNQAMNQVMQNAKDLMVFAGLLKYKLPAGVFEVLAREGQEVQMDGLR